MDSKKHEDSFECIASTSKDISSQYRNECSKNRMKRKSFNTAEQENKSIKKVRKVQEGDQDRIPMQESDFFGECDACGKSFQRRQYLIKHIKRKHKNKPDNLCDSCGKNFALKWELNSHIKDVHSLSLTICEICGRPFKNFKAYRDHRRNIHKSKCLCHICGKQIQEEYLKEHLQGHENYLFLSKQFTCPLCGMMFKSKFSMQQHILIHIGKKYYRCNICSESFIQSWYLYNHRKKMHTKSFPPPSKIPLSSIIENFLKKRETTVRSEK